MPLILNKDLAKTWLNENLSDEGIAEILKFEFPAAKMEAWPVNSIRTRKPDDETIIRKMNYENLPDL